MALKVGYKRSFKSQIEDVIKTFPSLSISLDEDPYLYGNLDIIDEYGKKWDVFSVEIRSTKEFPFRFPKLFETGGKIPPIPDWHVNGDGSCCIDVEPDEIISCKDGITVLEFLNKHAIPHLANQAFRRIEGYYKNGEYPHGVEGIILYYRKILKAENIEEVLSLLNYIGTHYRPNRVSMCFCGRNSKFRHCHRDAFDQIKQIPKEVLRRHHTSILAAI